MENLKVTNEMRIKLRSPLPSWALKNHPTKKDMTAINPMSVIERLNDVFGLGSWQLNTDVIIKDIKEGQIVVKTTLSIPSYGIHLEQYGGNASTGIDKETLIVKGGFDLGDAFKGASTDALTKICSYLEIGLSIYQGKGNIELELNNLVDLSLTQEQKDKIIKSLNKDFIKAKNYYTNYVKDYSKEDILWFFGAVQEVENSKNIQEASRSDNLVKTETKQQLEPLPTVEVKNEVSGEGYKEVTSDNLNTYSLEYITSCLSDDLKYQYDHGTKESLEKEVQFFSSKYKEHKNYKEIESYLDGLYREYLNKYECKRIYKEIKLADQEQLVKIYKTNKITIDSSDILLNFYLQRKSQLIVENNKKLDTVASNELIPV
jgi:hypothetical protein